MHTGYLTGNDTSDEQRSLVTLGAGPAANGSRVTRSRRPHHTEGTSSRPGDTSDGMLSAKRGEQI